MGRSFEYRARNKLLKMGATYVMRAASSKGAADLIALWPAPRCWDEGGNDPWLVQCKFSVHGGGSLPRAEAAVLKELAALTGGVPVLARPGKNGRGVEFINLNSKEKLG